MTSYVYFEDDQLSGEIMSLTLNFQLGITDLTIWNDSVDFMPRLRSLCVLPEVIFLDIHIGPTDGFGILKGIRADTAFDSAKIVAVTAGVTGDEVDQLQMAGFDGAIGKPIEIATFPEVLARIMRGERVWQCM
ncbi:MAG: response regulator [Chloroflexi bacterium]|uniref:response regulator n=1 Tax=Candidatus Flexifilum breve TaxID=3140694 RepID=UPI0031373183|nr:response regulator [Chloroflexota bacterium]